MRSSASFLVLILIAVVIGMIITVGQGDQTSIATASEDEITTVAEPFDITTGGGGSRAETTVTIAMAASPVENEGTTHAAGELTETQEWVKVPGTGVCLWPKPQSK